jgi:hypothetical protein
MRTNIEIDDELIREAPTLRAQDQARRCRGRVKSFDSPQQAEKILDLAGKVHWEGNLDESREGRFPA